MIRRVAQGIALAAVAGLLGLLVWDLAHGSKGGDFVKQVRAGERPPAPPLALPRLNGSGRLDLASLDGKVRVVNFWASWCHPCKQEAGRLESAWRRWRSRGVVFVGVDYNDFDKDGRRFLEKHGITYANVKDGPGASAGPWGLTGVPETYFVDRRGRVTDHVALEITAQQLEDGIRGALRS